MSKAFLPIIIILFFVFKIEAQDTAAYIETNYSPLIEGSDDTSALFLFKDELLAKQIFTCGEKHDSKGNSNIYKSLFYALNQKGIKHIAFELPFGWNYLINGYLNGDSLACTGLKNVMCKIRGNDWMQFFEWVYNYNINLPKNEKVTIDFIDMEAQKDYNPSIRCLQMLLPKNVSAPLKIESVIKKIKDFNQPDRIDKMRRIDKKHYKKLSKKLYLDMNQNDATYKDFLKENYSVFKKLSEGYYLANYESSIILFGWISIGSAKMGYNREDFMYKSYLQLMNKYKNEKIFSIHGKYHINLIHVSEFKDTVWNTVIEMLNTNEESPAKDKVCSMEIQYNRDYWYTNQSERIYFNRYCKTPLTIFKLNGDDTPFKKSSQLVHYVIINKY